MGNILAKLTRKRWTVRAFESIPVELLSVIFCKLDLPEVTRLKNVCSRFRNVIAQEWFSEDFRLRRNADTWLFVHLFTGDLEGMGILRGYNDCGNPINFHLDDLLRSVVFENERPCLLTASENVFLFCMIESKVLVILNPFTREVRRIACTHPLRNDSFLKRDEIKLLVNRAQPLEFRIVYGELRDNNPLHFIYDSVTNIWNVREAQHVVSTDNLDTTDERQIFVTSTPNRVTYMISFEHQDLNDPVFVNPEPVYYNYLSTINLPFLESPGWANSWWDHYKEGWMLAVNGDVNIEDTEIERDKMLLLFRLKTDWSNFDFVAGLPDDLVDKIKEVNMSVSVTYHVEEKNGSVNVAVLSYSYTVEDWCIFWFRYNIETQMWSDTTISRLNGVHIGGVNFLYRLTKAEN